MKLVLKLGIALFFIMVISTPIYAMDLSLSVTADEICESIRTEPERWIITDSKAVLFQDQDYHKRAMGKTWPDMESGVTLVVSFDLYYGYADVEKPLKIDYKDDEEIKLLKALKTYKYYEYKKDLGIKDKVVVKEVVKLPDSRRNSIKKLN